MCIAWASKENAAGGEGTLPALKPQDGPVFVVAPTSWSNPSAWQKIPSAAVQVSRVELLWLLEGSDELWCFRKVGCGLCRQERWDEEGNLPILMGKCWKWRQLLVERLPKVPKFQGNNLFLSLKFYVLQFFTVMLPVGEYWAFLNILKTSKLQTGAIQTLIKPNVCGIWKQFYE